MLSYWWWRLSALGRASARRGLAIQQCIVMRLPAGRPDVFLFSQDRAARPEPHEALSISMSFGSRALLMCRMRQLSATRLSLGWTRDENMACIACDTDCSALDEGTEMSDTLKFRVAHYCKVWRSDRALCAADVAPTCSHVAGSSGKAYRALPDRWLHRRSIPAFWPNASGQTRSTIVQCWAADQLAKFVRHGGGGLVDGLIFSARYDRKPLRWQRITVSAG